MSSRKSQGISINVIIVAAVALIVLIVLIAIFSGKLNLFSKTYAETTEKAQGEVCSAQGGRCYSTFGGADCPSGRRPVTPVRDWIDCSTNQICCEISS